MRPGTSWLSKQSLGGAWGYVIATSILDGPEPSWAVAYASIGKGSPNFEACKGNVGQHDEHNTREVEQICVSKKA